MASLILELPTGERRHVDLFKRVVSIGSDSGNDVVIDDADVPDTALTLRRDGASFVLESIGGSKFEVDGKKKSSAELGDGDAFDLGSTRVTVSREDAPQSQPAAPVPPAGGSEGALEALRRLHAFSERLLSDYDLPRLLETLMDDLIDLSGADKGLLILLEDGELNVKVARNVARENIEDAVGRVSDTIIAKVVRDRTPLIVSDALNSSEFGTSESVVNLKLSSVMCAPMMDKGELIGLIYVGNDSVVSLFTQADLEILTVFAGQASLLVANAVMVTGLLQEAERLKRALSDKRFGEIIGSCDPMREVFRKIEKVAPTDISVLVTGETGTGKELVAREIHRRSPRRDGNFVAINCGAIPENLLESELFGHVRGAFTGATATRDGRFQAASGGTLFLDEIGELPLQLQVKLLRALQDRQVVKVGETRPENVDIRVIAATNRDLEQEIKNGTFREDLYYRLNVITLELPPLRKRGDDVQVIARYLLEKYGEEYGAKVRGFSPAALKAIRRYTWPGNIRQLENRIRKAVVLAEKSVVGAGDLDLGDGAFEPVAPLQDALENFKRDYINEILDRNAGNRTRTARDLGVDPRTIFRHLERMASEDEA